MTADLSGLLRCYVCRRQWKTREQVARCVHRHRNDPCPPSSYGWSAK